MRISAKVSFGLTLVGLAVFGGLGVLQLAAEKRDLEHAALDDATTLVRATAESMRMDLGENDPHESVALLRSLERFDQRLDAVLWSRDEGGAFEVGNEERRESIDDLGSEALATGGVVTRIVAASDGSRVAMVAAPIESSRPSRAMVLSWPLDDIDADLREEARIVAAGVVAFSVLGGLLGFLLGEVYIRRPLARLERAMEVVAAGDLEAGVSLGRSDEVGSVLHRFEAMRGELRRARAQLRSEQEAHRATLERLTHADRLVTVGQLAAGLAHEIGSPLQILIGRAKKLEDRAGDDAELSTTARMIAAQAERITRIVQQLLRFARPRSRDIRPTDAVACAQAVVDLLEFEARRRNVELHFRATAIEPVMTDPDALQQIVLNLARNALAAVGGRTVRIDVTSVASEGARTLHLVVADDGIGMSTEARKRAFEPFFTTRSHEGGVGLGLPVVRSLVESLRGSVEVRTGDGQGTEFVVELPC